MVDDVAQRPKRSALFRARHWVFLSNPDWTEEELASHELVRRLDAVYLVFWVLSSIWKYLDQTAISNAYVSGMKEDLNLNGNQLIYFTSIFNAGYIIIIPFSQYLMNGVAPPNFVLPTLEIGWGLATTCLAAAKTYQHVYAIRFFIGLCEGALFPATMTMLLAWYTPTEVGLRIAITQAATVFGQVVAGFLQAALYTNLNGVHGLAGWQYLFLVNGVITMFIGFTGFFTMPGYPNQPSKLAGWYLKPRHYAIGTKRMGDVGRALPVGWKWTAVRALLKDWRLYVMFTAFQMHGFATTGLGYFALWLKSLKNIDGTTRFSVSQLNHIPIGGFMLTMVAIVTILTISSRTRTQWPIFLSFGIIGTIFAGILAHWDVPTNVKFASFFILFLTMPGNAVIVLWIGELASNSAEQRSVLIGACVIGYYIFNATVPIKVWPATQAPHYKIGWNFALAGYVGEIICALVGLYFQRRDQRLGRRYAVNDDESVTTPVGELSSKEAFNDGSSTEQVPSLEKNNRLVR